MVTNFMRFLHAVSPKSKNVSFNKLTSMLHIGNLKRGSASTSSDTISMSASPLFSLDYYIVQHRFVGAPSRG